ncbi:2134_t:CDS:1, partial [Acaulospora colombiana]
TLTKVGAPWDLSSRRTVSDQVQAKLRERLTGCGFPGLLSDSRYKDYLPKICILLQDV